MNMCKKLTLAGALLAAISAAGTAQAGTFFNGGKTFSDWQAAGNVPDSNGDSWWTLLYNSPAINGAHVALADIDIQRQTHYTVSFDFTRLPEGGLTPGNDYEIRYKIMMGKEQLSDAGLDTTVLGDHPPSTTVLKNIYRDAAMTDLLASLSSENGSHDTPEALTGYEFYVKELITVGDNMLLTNITNDFSTKIPEPGTMLLLGAGLLGLARSRRKLSACV